MNRGIYNIKLRAAKRRIFDALKKDGIEVNGVKHRKLISEYFNRYDIQRPIEMRWQDLIIRLYEMGKLGEPVKKEKPTKSKEVPQWKQAYIDYINSDAWKSFRLKALDHYGHQCILCSSTKNLHVHHRHYKTLYHETFADVIPLCAGCHKKHHKK